MLAAEVSFWHKLSDPTDDDAYHSGDMKTLQEIVLASGYYLIAGQVRKVLVAPRVVRPPERIGNVVVFAVSVTVLCA